MSNIKQERHFSSTSGFPTTGAENVEYTSRADVYGKDWYWDPTTGKYERKIGNILEFPYSNSEFPSLNTIQKALDHLLSDDLGVSLSVSPSYVRTIGEQEFTFVWVINKIPSNISSVVITGQGYNSGELVDTMLGTSGALTDNVTIGSNLTFTITVIDTDGNTATATDTVDLISTGLSATLTVAPDEYLPGSGAESFTFSWTINDQYVGNLEELTLTGPTDIPIDILGSTTDSETEISCSGTYTTSLTPMVDTTYTLYAKVNDSLFTSVDVPENITLSIEPGVKIKMRTNINVFGSLQAKGTIEEPISILNQEDTAWSVLNFLNSTSSLEYVQISRGGYLPVGTTAMVMAENSNLNFDHMDFFNPASSYNILYFENSITSIFNSNLYRDTYGNDSRGIKVFGGSLILNNTNFNGFGRAIEMYDNSTLTLEDMSEDNFQNILTNKWWPETAWNFASST